MHQNKNLETNAEIVQDSVLIQVVKVDQVVNFGAQNFRISHSHLFSFSTSEFVVL
jgi:hypothetical protein